MRPIYNILKNKIINNITFNSQNDEETINNMYLILNEFENKSCSYLNKVIVIIEYYQLNKCLKIKNQLPTTKFIGGLKFLYKYLFNLNYVLQSPVINKNYIYKGNIKIPEHEQGAWK